MSLWLHYRMSEMPVIKSDEKMNYKNFYIFSTIVWAIYLIIFPYEFLVSGPSLYWLQLFFSISIFSLCISCFVKASKIKAIIIAISTLVFTLLNILLWMAFTYAANSNGKSNLGMNFLFFIETKWKLFLMTINSGNIWSGLSYAYFELMPIVQMLFFCVWLVLAKKLNGTAADKNNK